jgi:predicted GNAT superfamily acetyltransferase
MSDRLQLRDLRSLDECREVVALQEEVWGVDGETVPASVLFVSAKRGGILIGAIARVGDVGADEPEDALAGFVWSLPGRRDATPTHWSHMLGVRPRFRSRRVGERLKLAQRAQALAQDVHLIEWTFDPLQAANAHFNLRALGGIGASYGVDVYGPLSGHLHRGTPTDRLFIEWWISEPHVQRRLANREEPEARSLIAVSSEIADAPSAIVTQASGPWLCPVGFTSDLDDRRFLVPVPPKYSEMQQSSPDLAMAWRLAVREVMVPAFARGYRAVDFYLNREAGGGAYLLAK